jgi:ferredoxin
MLLKRRAADADLSEPQPYLPPCRVDTGKCVAIVGAGPAGLAAAYYLRQMGHACTVFDDHAAPGGMLRYGVGAETLPRRVLDAEIAAIERLGVRFRLNTRVGPDVPAAELRRDFHAVLLALGQVEIKEPGVLSSGGRQEARAGEPEHAPIGSSWPGVGLGKRGIEIDGRSYRTAAPGVFAAGDVVRRQRLTVRAVADGREAAVAIDQQLSGGEPTGERQPFTVRIGRLRDGEIKQFLPEAANPGPRHRPSGGPGAGFTQAGAAAEAGRCLHCDCRKPDTCKLRRYADLYDAKVTRFRGERRSFRQLRDHPNILYEPGKCIACGLCVQIAADAGEPLGMTFLHRGMDVRVAVPFGRPLSEGLQRVAAECVAACPTAALSFR